MKRWKKALAGAFLAAIFCGLSPLHAAAVWPDRMNYQGQLTDLAGNAVADGSYNLTFSLWDNATAIPLTGSKVWGDETHAVTVTKGLFNVILGSNGAPLSTLTALQWNSDLYLQIVVSGTDTLNPRQPIIHANNAHRLQGLQPNNSANNLVVLDGSGKIPAGLVQGSSLSLPFDMTGAGGAYNLKVNNNSGLAGDKGIWTLGAPALRAEAATTQGDAIVAVTNASDNNAANAVRATANNGIAVLAQSTSYIGLSATSAGNYAIYADGYSGSYFRPGYIWGSAVTAVSNQGYATGLLGDGNYDAGVHGYNSGGGYGMFGESTSGIGGYFYSGNSYGIYGYSSGSWGGYFYGQNGIQVDASSSYGVYAHGPSYGVYAYSENVGIYAYSNSSSSYGIQGDNNTGGANSAGIYGNGYTGVWGNSSYSGGRGVYGVASAGNGIGVAGEHAASTGVAVQGLNTYNGASGASAMGVRGEARGGGSKGVFGLTAGSGAAAGVYGVASPTASSGFGVYGEGQGLAAYGGKFVATAAGAGVSYGVEGRSNAGTGYGVYGSAPYIGVGAVGTYGLYASTTLTGGAGAFGSSTTLAPGVWGQTSNTSSGANGVQGIATNNTFAGTTGVYGNGYTGVYGVGYARGVSGVATLDSMAAYGVYGNSAWYGGYFYASRSSGTTYGVHAQVASPSGYGFYTSLSTSGAAVFGQNLGGSGGYGGQFSIGQCCGRFNSGGSAVYASYYGDAGYGVYGYSYGYNSAAVYGYEGWGDLGSAAVVGNAYYVGVSGTARLSGSNSKGVAGQGYTGVEANSNHWGFYAKLSNTSGATAPPPAGFVVYDTSAEPNTYGGYFYNSGATSYGVLITNSAPTASDAGYALRVVGKIQAPTCSGKTPLVTGTSWVVNTACATGTSAILITPATDTAGIRVWVSNQVAGSFTVSSSASITSFTFYWWVVDY